MLEATPRIDEGEFRRVTAELVARAERGTGQIAAVPPADAEDVVQDGWEREIRKRRTGKKQPLPHGDELLAHMSATVADTSVEHRRRMRRKKEIPPTLLRPLELVPEAATVGGGDVEEEALARIAADALYRTISEELDPEVQRLTVLSALGYTEREAAEELGMTTREVDAARQRLRRRTSSLTAKVNTDSVMSERKESA